MGRVENSCCHQSRQISNFGPQNRHITVTHHNRKTKVKLMRSTFPHRNLLLLHTTAGNDGGRCPLRRNGGPQVRSIRCIVRCRQGQYADSGECSEQPQDTREGQGVSQVMRQRSQSSRRGSPDYWLCWFAARDVMEDHATLEKMFPCAITSFLFVALRGRR